MNIYMYYCSSFMLLLLIVSVFLVLYDIICLVFSWWIVKFTTKIKSLQESVRSCELEKDRVREETCFEVKCHCVTLWRLSLLNFVYSGSIKYFCSTASFFQQQISEGFSSYLSLKRECIGYTLAILLKEIKNVGCKQQTLKTTNQKVSCIDH